MKPNLVEDLNKICDIQCDVPLSSMTTLKIGGLAKYVAYPDTDIALDSLIRFCKEKELSYKVIGKGSNLLCSDDVYEGVVIRLDRYFTDIIFHGTTVTVQAGLSIIALATLAAKKGLSGLEFACGIPATVGGTLFMNAGAYKSCMADVVKEVFVYHDGKAEWIPNEACQFSYRHSIFQTNRDWIILAARLELVEKDSEEIFTLMENRRTRRIASQPLNYPSCGSVFRNPDGMNAWELIEGIGYRGHRLGGAEVSNKHCNFIVNVDHATANEYLALVHEVQQKVYDKYGVTLITEMEKFNWK